MRKVFLGISASIRKVFNDVFSTRSNTTGSLGTASDGSQWEAVSKIIEVQGGKAVANYIPQPSDSGSEYPIAVVNMPTQNNIITLEDTNIGSGVALWVQTSADWWMVSADSSYTFVPASTNYTSNQQFFENNQFTSTESYINLGTTYSSSTTSATTSAYTNINSYLGGTNYTFRYTRRPSPVAYTRGFSSVATYFRNTFSTQIFSRTYSGTFSADTGYTISTDYTSSPQGFTSSIVYTSMSQASTFSYSSILKISRSVSDVVSEISSLIVSSAQTIKSIVVQTSGTQITAKAFAEITPISQIGNDLIYNATGAIINTKYGISISKAEYANDEIAGSVKIEIG
jgi:hypothetical protein